MSCVCVWVCVCVSWGVCGVLCVLCVVCRVLCVSSRARARACECVSSHAVCCGVCVCVVCYVSCFVCVLYMCVCARVCERWVVVIVVGGGVVRVSVHIFTDGSPPHIHEF